MSLSSAARRAAAQSAARRCAARVAPCLPLGSFGPRSVSPPLLLTRVAVAPVRPLQAWDADSSRLLRTMAGHRGWVTDLCFVPALRMLFSCSTDGTIRAWDDKGREVQCIDFGEPRQASKEVAGGATGVGGSTAAAAGLAGETASLGKAAGGGAGRSDGPAFCLAWSAKRWQLIAGGNNGMIHLYKCKKPAELKRQEMSRMAMARGGGNGYTKRSLKGGEAPDRGSHVLTHYASVRSHKDIVRGLCVNNKSGKLFSVGYDRAICVYDTERPKEFLRLEGCHEGAICAVTLDTENNWLITGAYDGRVKMWSQEGRCLDTFTGVTDNVIGLAYAPATRNYWITSKSRRCAVYDPRTPMDITEYVANTSSLGAFDVTKIHQPHDAPDVLVGLTQQRQVVLWQYNPCAALRVLHGHGDWVEALCAVQRGGGQTNESSLEAEASRARGGSDGSSLTVAPSTRSQSSSSAELSVFSAGADGLLLRWQPSSELNTDVYTCVEELSGHSGGILAICHCVSLDILLTGAEDATIRVWYLDGRADAAGYAEMDAKAGGGDRENEVPDVLCGHEGRVTALACCADAVLASGGGDRKLCFWDLHTRHCIKSISAAHERPIQALCFAAERDELASCGGEALAKVWCTRSYSLKYVLSSPGGLADVSALGYITTRMAARAIQKHKEMLEKSSVKARRRSSSSAEAGGGAAAAAVGGETAGQAGDSEAQAAAAEPLTSKTSTVSFMSGQWACAGDDGVVRLFDAEDAELVWDVVVGGGAPTAAHVDIATGVLLVASQDRRVRVVDLGRRCVGRTYTGHTDAIRCIAEVPQRGHYLTGSWDKSIVVWLSHSSAHMSAHGGAKGHAQEGAYDGEEGAEETFVSSYEREHPLVVPKALRAGKDISSLVSRVSKGGATGGLAKKGAKSALFAQSTMQEAEAVSKTTLGDKLGDLEDTLQHRHYGGAAPLMRRKAKVVGQ